MILESVPRGLRGRLTRWLLELRSGVFVGNVSARVRQGLWETTCGKVQGGNAILIYSSDTEQGFRVDFWGSADRMPDYREGLVFIREPLAPSKEKWLARILRDS